MCNRGLEFVFGLRICEKWLDVAVALQYMHQIMNPTYVHSNVKSRNIFLDDDFEAKIGIVSLETLSGQIPNVWLSQGYIAVRYVESI
ncbi:hypothetical protein V6N13_085985 [Hibiscus sabdariffa]|uniref:Protein kinase domain-containing protein n=1 Tax=Hibiscus sabdariffa TaxID=183260 RepID=A0ABR2FRV9_9ROSI